jgi:hypothetical protein
MTRWAGSLSVLRDRGTAPGIGRRWQPVLLQATLSTARDIDPDTRPLDSPLQDDQPHFTRARQS